MDFWFETEIRARRDIVLQLAARTRNIRIAHGRRRRSVRARIADGAQTMSDRLAQLALALRGTEQV